MSSQSLFDKVWDTHVVHEAPEQPTVLYIDLHLVHEVTSPQAFTELAARGLKVRRPDRTFATMDHSTPTVANPEAALDDSGRAQLKILSENAANHGVTLYPMGHPKNGVVHIMGPERGLTQPAMTVVCGDSHTATHGAFGALAFGIGTSEVGHVLATQCLLARKPKVMQVRVDGTLRPGVTAKDIILAIIAKIGTGGATEHAIEYVGSAIISLDMDSRMTVCNMSIEAGARTGMIAPDDVTFNYLAGREFAPKGANWDHAIARWRALSSDQDAHFDSRVVIDATDLAPMVTYGTSPGMGVSVVDRVPSPDHAHSIEAKQTLEKALKYMGLQPGAKMTDCKVDVVFVGSCTNGRISDLRAAASVLKGRKIAGGVRMLVVPGSHDVKKEAEAEGLDAIFKAAGAEWREPGCSMCIAMNGDNLTPGQYAVSTSNRNFEGRQGKGGRTFLASPLTAAASAINGRITDVRTML